MGNCAVDIDRFIEQLKEAGIDVESLTFVDADTGEEFTLKELNEEKETQ